MIDLTREGDNKRTETHPRLSAERQLRLFEEAQEYTTLDSKLWTGSFNGRESSLQQLSPYVGKLKSGMVHVLIELYSKPGDIVLDPFSGSGVVPLEAVLLGRIAMANDLSPYAYVLTKAKLEAPDTLDIALESARKLVDEVEKLAPSEDTSTVPDWVKEFFHPKTLSEVVIAFRLLRERENYFLTACLLGILHHVRPGFLSYPSSHLVPYVRKKKYPPDQFPSMYEYRDLRSRLLSKIKRMYRRHMLPENWSKRKYEVWSVNSMALPIENGIVDTIISSPPYFGALDYARDNRLRLWFLGCDDWRELDKSLTANSKVYLEQMSVCLREMDRVLKQGGHCILVLGDVERNGKSHKTAEILSELAAKETNGRFVTKQIYDDIIPDERRSRRLTRTTKFERILVMQKS